MCSQVQLLIAANLVHLYCMFEGMLSHNLILVKSCLHDSSPGVPLLGVGQKDLGNRINLEHCMFLCMYLYYIYIYESTESTTSCQYMEINTHLLPQKQG